MFDVKWEGFKDINDLAEKLSKVDPALIQKQALAAAHDFGQQLYDEIMKWLDSGKQDWPRLSDVTTMLRAARNEKNTPGAGEDIPQYGSQQPLVDKGSFKRAIQLEKDDAGAVVGILIPKGENGKDMEMIARIIEGGASIPVTDKMRSFLAAKGIHLRKTTRVLVVPARPLFNPAADLLDENLDKWMEPYEDVILKEIGLGDK